VVSGGYKEVLYTPVKSFYDNVMYLRAITKDRQVGKWGWRNAHKTIHKVLVDKPRTFVERKEAPLTFILRGPYIREWHFYKNSNPILWWKYLGLEGPQSRE
jgi:hypothetical protein